MMVKTVWFKNIILLTILILTNIQGSIIMVRGPSGQKVALLALAKQTGIQVMMVLVLD